MMLDTGREPRQRAVEDGVDVLGLKHLRHRCRADGVDEHHRHLLELLCGGSDGRGLGAQTLESDLQGGDGHVDDAVAEQCPLAFECGDAGLDLLQRRFAGLGSCHGQMGRTQTPRMRGLRRRKVRIFSLIGTIELNIGHY
jgi:hypothetical protein